jgi:hypothetical protein
VRRMAHHRHRRQGKLIGKILPSEAGAEQSGPASRALPAANDEGLLVVAPSAVNPRPGQVSPGFSAWRMIGIVRDDMASSLPERPFVILKDHNLRSIIIALMWAIALAGFKPFGQVWAQFMIVWQR